MSTIQVLEQMYTDFKAHKDLLAIQEQEALDALITPEIRAQMEKIRAEFKEANEAIDVEMGPVEKRLRDEVLASGASFTGDVYQVQFVRPQLKVKNLAGLLIFAKTNPTVLEFMEESAPTTRIVRKK